MPRPTPTFTPFSLSRRRLARLCLGLAAVSPLAVLAQAPSPNAQTVRLVVGYAAGGPVDAAARLFAMYGLTEAFRSTFLDPALIDSHPTSMGKAIPHAEILVVNDAGQIAADNEEGELVHTGPLVAQGYWQDAERTTERYKPAPQGSLYGGTAVWSGDRVRRDADGLLYFVGRRDAMIKSAGNRISPQEVEEAAVATGLVAEAVALGLPDPQLGAAIHLVVRASGDEAAARAELIPALTRALPNFMVPRHVHWREVMPVSPNGKLDRVQIRNEVTS